ncbi:MAG: hypothetical protein FJ291_04130 [Planctomycetes bacterium]|nr:hypothetical protein [Planctomycetota bacterium]
MIGPEQQVAAGGPAERRSGPGRWGRAAFDVAFGILFPLACFLLDPFLFRGWFMGAPPRLMHYKLLAYGGAGLGMLSLALWLAVGQRSGRWSALSFGGMAAAAFIAAGLGVILLPLTIMGLVAGIGVLGFVPFVTAYVYLHNATQANRSALCRRPPKATAPWALAGAFAVLGVPALAQWRTNAVVRDSIQSVIDGDVHEQRAIDRLKWAHTWGLANVDPIVNAYAREEKPARKDELARAYTAITGGDIEVRRREMD